MTPTPTNPLTGHPIRFGYFLVPNAPDPLIETAQRVEALGLDYVGIQDHPYQRRYLDTWALMPAIVQATSELRVFPNVANLPLRPPALLAKAAATIDVLSGGRFELGLGAGAFWDAIAAWDGPRRSPGESLAALEEAIEVIRKVWSGERNLRFDGDYYDLAGAQSGPVPAHDLGIWLGAYGPRALRLTGRLADGWVPSYQGDMEKISQMTQRLDAAIDDAGRQRGDVRRILNVNGTITDAGASADFDGPADQWADGLTHLALTHGFDTFIFGGAPDDQLERFAREVVPATRAQLTNA